MSEAREVRKSSIRHHAASFLYTYDTDGHLTGVSMPRPSGTQTRTFNYNSNGLMTSQVNPESGTKTYAYNSDKTLQSVTDAKSQQTQYSYDSLKRVTQIRRGALVSGSFNEDTCQREDYSYDTNPYDASYTQSSAVRLAAVQYKGGRENPRGSGKQSYDEGSYDRARESSSTRRCTA